MLPVNPDPRHPSSTAVTEFWNLAGCEHTKRTGIDKAIGYLTRHRSRLDYPTALARDWPIATGVIEGACRHIVADRLDITGARWGLAGA